MYIVYLYTKFHVTKRVIFKHEHDQRKILNFINLRSLAPEIYMSGCVCCGSVLEVTSNIKLIEIKFLEFFLNVKLNILM